MEAQLTKDYVNAAIKAELEKAKKDWGSKYSSTHEAYAVLKEEVEEAADDLNIIQDDLAFLWNMVKGNSDKPYSAALKHIQETALALAIEAVQIAAVAKKAEL